MTVGTTADRAHIGTSGVPTRSRRAARNEESPTSTPTGTPTETNLGEPACISAKDGVVNAQLSERLRTLANVRSRSHNPKVAGSNPAPATIETQVRGPGRRLRGLPVGRAPSDLVAVPSVLRHGRVTVTHRGERRSVRPHR